MWQWTIFNCQTYFKTVQLRCGVNVFVGKTDDPFCPVAAVLAYMVIQGGQTGSFFKFQDDKPLTKAIFTQKIRQPLQELGLHCKDFAGHSWSCHSSGHRRLHNQNDGSVEQLSFTGLHQNTTGAVSKFLC